MNKYQQDKWINRAKEVSETLLYCATLANDIALQFKKIAMNIEKLKSCMERHKITVSGDNR